ARPGVAVYAAGVAAGGGGLVTAGGRVLGVTATAPTIGEARRRAYGAVAAISWPGMIYRSDIAAAATSKEKEEVPTSPT
ncbi:MAG: phosphoribosylglycinamide synthetase C domain-containing protein, partial [Acidimicrobiales bacterium]